MTDGYKAVQSTHAAINFTFEHPSRAGPWFKDSNYLVQLEVENEQKLKELIQKCRKKQLYYTIFREPDIGNEITAIAIEPSPLTQKLVSHLPLLFKSKTNEQDNNGHQSTFGQPYKEDSLQEEMGRNQDRRKRPNTPKDILLKLANALGIKRLQGQKEAESQNPS